MNIKQLKFLPLIITVSVFISCSTGNYLEKLSEATIDFDGHLWKKSTPQYSEWKDTGTLSCNSWLPKEDQIPENQKFVQISNDCSIEQIRDKQNREINEDNQYRDDGEPIVQRQLIMYQTDTRSAIGTKK